MDKLKTNILLISLVLILLFSIQGAAATSDDANLTSENIDLSICDNEGDADSDNILAAANSEDMLGEGEGNFNELQDLIDANYGRDLTLNKGYTSNKEREITITGPITIYGNGNTLNANGEWCIFKVTGSNVVIRDIVFTNGNATAGGAINWQGENGKLINCSFTNNYAAENGGAVEWFGQSGNIINCSFTNNTSPHGGAVYWYGDWDRGKNGELTNCDFTSNNAHFGGAVDWWGESGKLINCSFTNNNALENAGAVHWAGENGKLTNCSFTNNTASDGGAINWGGKSGKLTNSNFTNNNATIGGAVYWTGESGNITNCNFTNNNATTGGTVYWTGDNGNITNSNFTNNNARHGGAVNWHGDNGKLTNCNFTNNTANEGGAISWNGPHGKLTNSNFINNHAHNGGAVLWKGNDGNLTNSNFTNNRADNQGGAVHWQGYNGNLTNSNFTNNTSPNGGAVLWIASEGKLTNSSFTNNKATDRGGAINWVGPGGKLTNCNLTNNTADNRGGAIYWNSVRGNVINSILLNNKVRSTSLTANNGNVSLTLTFKGRENLINAIYGVEGLILSDVTYWNGEITTDSPSTLSDCEAGQNITIEVYDADGNLVDNSTMVTNLQGEVKYDYTHLFDGNYTYVAYHPDDAYYTYINATGNFTLKRIKTNITISVENATYGEFPVANITADVAGNYTLIIANKTYDPVVFTQQDVDNHRVKQVAVDELLDAKEGYVASVHFKGNEFYSTETRETQFNIEKGSSTIAITDFTSPINIGDDASVEFEINPKLGNYTVTLCINGSEIATYDFKNNIGEFLITKDNFTSKGTYNITVQWQGNSNYNASNIAYCIITVNKINVTMKAEGSTVYYGENATITVTGLPGDAAGNVSVRVGNGIFFADIENGEAIIEIPDLPVDKYEGLIVNYSGDDKYNNASAEATVIVNPASSKIVIDPIDNVTYGEDVIVTYSVENKTSLNITVTDAKGGIITDGIDASVEGKVVISGLDAGEYAISISNAEKGNYLGFDAEATFTVLKANSTIGAANKTFDYPEDVILVASGENCTGINESTVVVRDLNGIVAATVKVDGFKMTIKGLGAGDYTVSYNNTVGHNWISTGNATGISILKANSSVSAPDVEVTYGNPIVINVDCENATEISYKIIDWEKVVVKEGTINIDENITGLDLAAGIYTINLTTIVNGNYTATSNTSKITVDPAESSVSAEDVNASYGEAISIAVTSVNATEVSYKIMDATGNVVANGTVEPNGTIRISDLTAGDYTVNLTTVTDENHTSASGSSRLHVKHVVTIVIAPISGYTGEVVNFTAQFKYENGDPVNRGTAGLAIKYDDRQVLGASMYSILGADDTYSTGVSGGKSTFNVKLGSPGTYPYVVTYSGEDVDAVLAESTVTILKLNTTVSGDDVSGKPSDEKSITINVLDQNNNTVNNGTVTLTLNGNTYNTTVDNGKAVLNVELPNPGTYDATVKYNGNDYYGSSESSISVNVKKVNTNAPSAEDVSGKAGEKTDISIEITDENSNPVKNGTATLTIDGETYTAEVKKGVATFKDVELPEKDTVADVYYQGNDYYNSNSSTFSIKIKQDNNDTEPDNNTEPENNTESGNNTDENPTEKYVSSKAVDARATGNPIAILVLTLFTLVIIYRKK
ncbi:Ig-like domain repeat protein [Methanobrevibacter sp.]|uniref:Ig-like domain repeat protein n=1 Tax=Methanobrevibacter sp. TaxID=66852 RepID=UPI00388E2C35